MALFSKLFGSYSEKQIKKIDPIAKQVDALVLRLARIGVKDVVVGISGGLDSALALLVAVGAFAGLHPCVVAVGLEAVLPHIHEIVFIDVALMIVGTDACAGGDGTVAQHPGYRHSRVAEEEVISHRSFVVAEEALATVAGDYAALLAVGFDELHEAAELLVGNLQLRILRGTAHREHREEAPFLESAADEELFDLVQFIVVAGGHTGDHVEAKVRSGAGHADSLFGPLEAAGHAAHPVVIVAQAVELKGHGAKASPH